MDKKHIFAGIGVLVLVVIVGLSLHGSSSAPVQQTPKAGDASPISAYPYTCVGNVCSWKINVACATASTTLFDVANPWQATSTVSIDWVEGIGQATTTLFSVGTTTVSSGLALSNLSQSFIAGVSVATTTQFSVIAGQTADLGTSQLSAGAATVGKSIIGATEYVGAFGTSTATAAGSANYIGGLAACSAGMTFTRTF